MTVEELITKLRKFPGKTKVQISYTIEDNGYFGKSTITPNKNKLPSIQTVTNECVLIFTDG